jgi:activator of HSP90 ATPase
MTESIHQEIDISTAPTAIYETLIDSAKFSELTGGLPTEIDPKTGGTFSLFGGMITGINVECLPGERLVQAWRAGNWEPGVYSMVRFELKTQDNGETRVILDHTGYPDGETDHLSSGWHDNYWNPLQKLFSA